MSELDSLASRAADLSSKADFWNNAVLWALAITALAAVAIVVSQRLAFVRSKQLSDVQDKITTIKEAAAKDRTDLLEKSAADAKVAQQEVEIELAKAKTVLEGERQKRLQLQRSAVRRMIPLTTVGQHNNWDSLKPFAGVQVEYFNSPQQEPRDFASNLGACPSNPQVRGSERNRTST